MVPALRQVSGRDGRRGAGPAEAAAAAAVRRLSAGGWARPTICASGSPPAPPSPSPLASSAQARSSSATSESSTCLMNSRERKRPTSGFLGDAMAGNGALFTREDAVEAAWAVVDPVLKNHHRACHYRRGSWGPIQADALIAAAAIGTAPFSAGLQHEGAGAWHGVT